jgi:hypothetical protein
MNKDEIVEQTRNALLGTERIVEFGDREWTESEIRSKMEELKRSLQDINEDDKFKVVLKYDKHLNKNVITLKKGKRYLSVDDSFRWLYSWSGCKQAKNISEAWDLIKHWHAKEIKKQLDWIKREELVV